MTQEPIAQAALLPTNPINRSAPDMTAEGAAQADAASSAAAAEATAAALIAGQPANIPTDRTARDAIRGVLLAAHRAARKRRNAASDASEAYISAVTDIGRIEVAIARLDQPDAAPAG
jgi:hypothetical protein